MLNNASILSIEVPETTGGGDVVYRDVPLPGPIPVTLDDPSFQQRWTINQLQLDATATLYVELAAMRRLPEIPWKSALRLSIRGKQIPGTEPPPAIAYVVRHVVDRISTALPHLLLYVRVA